MHESAQTERAAGPEVPSTDAFRVAEWQVRPRDGLVSKGSVETPVRPKTMDVLLVLAARPGTTILKEELLETVWASLFVEEKALSQCISELRLAFGEDAKTARIITTVPKRGYRLSASVSLDTDADEPSRAPWHRRATRWLAAAAIVLAATMATWPERSQSEPVEAVPAGRSAVVLEIMDLSPESAKSGWASRALASLITVELGLGTELSMVPPDAMAVATADTPQASAVNPPADLVDRLRTNLGVDLIVGGSYVVTDEEGSKVRVDLAVIDASTREVVAGYSDFATLAEIGELAYLAGRSLRDQLAIAPSSAGAARAADALRPGNLRALRLYYEGIEAIDQHELLRAAHLFEASLATEASAVAYLELARVWQQLGYDTRAIDAAQTARRELPEGGHAEERLWLAAQLALMTGHWDEAVQDLVTLTELSPANLSYALTLGEALAAGGDGDAARAQLEALLEAGRGTGGVEVRARIALARLDLERSEVALALEWAEGAQRTARASGLERAEAEALLVAASASYEMGRPAEGRDQLWAALALYEAMGDPSGTASGWNTLGSWYAANGQLDQAENYAAMAEAAFGGIGNRSGLADSRLLKGRIALLRSRKAEADRNFTQAREIYSSVGDTLGEARSVAMLAASGPSYRDRQAESLFREAVDLFAAAGHGDSSRRQLDNRARHEMRFGDLELAVSYLGTASEAAEREFRLRDAAGSRLTQAYGYLLRGLPLLARESFERANGLFLQLENRAMVASTLDGLGATYSFTGQRERALALHEESLAIRQEEGATLDLIESYASMATALSCLGRHEEGKAYAEKAVRMAAAGEYQWYYEMAQLELAFVLQHAGETQRALEIVRSMGDPVLASEPPAGMNVALRRMRSARLLLESPETEQWGADLLATVHRYGERRRADLLTLETRLALALREDPDTRSRELESLGREAAERGLTLIEDRVREALEAS